MTFEGKIKEYLDKEYPNKYFNAFNKDIASCLAKIAEENYEVKFFEFVRRTDELEKDIEDLELQRELQQKAINTLNDSGLKLMEENKKLKGQLDNYQKIKAADIKILWNTINTQRQQLSKIMAENMEWATRLDVYEKDGIIKTLNRQEVENLIFSSDNLQNIITAICNLAVPEINKDKIIEVLNETVYKFECKNECGDRYTECDVMNEIIKSLGGK